MGNKSSSSGDSPGGQAEIPAGMVEMDDVYELK
jgi:hypothetical protein